MGRVLLIVLLVLSGANAMAQDRFVYDKYLFDNYLMNPACAGADKFSGSIKLIHRQQWVGMKEAPYTSVLSFQHRIDRRVGLGGYLLNDQNGFNGRRGGQASFAYHIPFFSGRGSRRYNVTQLSFGIAVQAIQYTVDERGFTYPGSTTGGVDGAVTGGVASTLVPNANAGMFYQHKKGFFAGVSIANLLPTTPDIFDYDSEPIKARRYYWQMGANLKHKRYYTYSPSMIFFVDENGRKQLNVDMKMNYLNLRMHKDLWCGISYQRNFDSGAGADVAIVPVAGINVAPFMFAYSVDIGLYGLQKYNYGSHQFMIGYSLFRSTKKKAIPCPRFLKDALMGNVIRTP